jgi:hypothetical protein
VDHLRVVKGGNGLADTLAVDDAVIGSFRGQEMHGLSVSHPQIYI